MLKYKQQCVSEQTGNIVLHAAVKCAVQSVEYELVGVGEIFVEQGIAQ